MDWFRVSIVSVYSERIPKSVDYLCEALDIEDPWVTYLVENAKK